jgi:ADP-heptose:LPS heptosyltransferase
VKILVLRFSSIGDIVLTTPVLRCLSLQLPNAEIHYCTKPKFVGLVQNNPFVSKVFPLSDSLADLATQLRKEKYDLIVDLHSNLRTRILKALLWKVKSVTFSKLNSRKWWYVRFKQNVMPDVHIVHRYMKPLEAINVFYDGQGLDYYIPEQVQIAFELPEHFVAFVVGGTFSTKRMPLDKMEEIIEGSNRNFVLLGDASDHERVKLLKLRFPEKVTDLCGSLDLNQSAAVVKMADIVMSHDTGFMHIAAALKKQVLSIWGNTVPEFGMYPLFPNNMLSHSILMAEVKELSCRPCSKLGFSDCPKGHFHCMRLQNTDAIIKALGHN